MPAFAGMTTMPAPKILVIPGSLRTGSHNARLAALAAKELALAEAEVTRISLEDYPLPLFDADLARVRHAGSRRSRLKQMLMAHQGVFITSPEYSASVTPLLKNAIDWVSRVREGGEPTYAAFKNRVFAIGSATASSSGGVRSLMALRQILELGCGALVIPEQVSVPRADEAFDDMDNLKDETRRRGAEGHGAAAGRTGERDELDACCNRKCCTMQLKPRERLIVALDVSSVEAAQRWWRGSATRSRSTRSAISSPLPAGLPYAHTLIDAGKQVFVDLKLHDIGNTVAQGVKSVARLGATLPHRARLSADHAGRGRGARRQFAHSRRHRAHLVRRCRSQSRRLCHDRGRARRPPRRASARHRRRRPGLLARRGGKRSRHRRRQALLW